MQEGNLIKQPSPEGDNLESAREEVWETKIAENGKGSVHFIDVNPDELASDDLRIWKRLTAGALSMEEFQRYRDVPKTTISAQQFEAAVANIFMGQRNKEEWNELQAFKDEIRRIKEDKVAHFSLINPNLLTEKDMEIWNSFKERVLNQREFDNYRSGLFGDDSRVFAEGVTNAIVAWNDDGTMANIPRPIEKYWKER